MERPYTTWRFFYFQVLVLLMTSEIYGQAHSTTEGQGTSGTLMIKPPKESYQLNQVQVVQSPKLH